MDNIILQLITRLDSSKTADDIKKIQEQLNAKGITLKPVLDTATSKKEIQNLAKQLQSIMSSIDPKFGEIGVKEYTSAINATISATKKATAEQEKSNKAMEAAFEKTERMRQAEEKRQQTAQNNAINKNLEAEYKEREKLANLMADGRESARVNALQVEAKAIDDLNVKMEKQASTYRELRSSGKTEFSFEKANNGFAELEKMGLATKKLKSDMAELNRLYRAIDPSNSQTLVSTYGAFDTQLKKVNNSLGVQKLGLSEVKNQISQIDKANFANQIQAWRRVNSAAEKDFGGTLDGLLIKLREIDNKSDFSNLQKKFRGVKAEADALGVTGKSVGDTFASSARKFTEWIVSAGAVMTVIQSIRQMIKNVIDLDTELVDLKKTTDATTTQLEKFYYSSNETAKQLGVSTKEIISATSAWSRLGYSIKDANTMAKNSAILESISPDLNIDKATDGLVSSLKAFKLDAEDSLDGIISKINVIGNTQAVNNGDIVDILTRSSSAMSEANNTLEQTIALGTAATEIVRDSASVGTALKTISMRLRGYDEETESYTNNVEVLTGTIANLTKTAQTPGGISLFTDETKQTYKSTYQLLEDISKVYSQLSDKNQAELLEAIAG